MVDCLVYRLRPRAPFHFGERGVGLEASERIFRSDSLFSAIVSAVRELEGANEAEALLSPFLDERREPPFLVSSCFPFVADVLLLPRPFLRPNLPRDPKVARLYKNVQYVSIGIWQRLAAGLPLDSDLRDENLYQHGSVWLRGEEAAGLRSRGLTPDASLWSTQVSPRVSLDRQTSASEIYGCGRAAYSRGTGLYFLARFEDASLRPRVEAALRLLGESGLGGERSSGCGSFEPELPPIALEFPTGESPSAFAALACYKPTLAELRRGVLAPPASYDLVSRFGWVCSPEGAALRRKDVAMLVEGSVTSGDRPRGALVDVTPDGFQGHRVYRSGLAFPVPVKIDREDDGR